MAHKSTAQIVNSLKRQHEEFAKALCLPIERLAPYYGWLRMLDDNLDSLLCRLAVEADALEAGVS